MIQRKQSIFILVAIGLLISLIAIPLDSFGSIKGLAELHWNALLDVTPGTTSPLIRSLIPLAILIILPLILNAVGLFLFKYRPVQMRFIGIAAGIEIGLTAILIYLSISIADGMQADTHFNVRWLIPLAAAVMDILAYRAISDDEALIQSLNRLR